MKKLAIKITELDDGRAASIAVYDGDVLLSEGTIGGEPEDNNIGRAYAWVVPMLERAIEACGGQAVHVRGAE